MTKFFYKVKLDTLDCYSYYSAKSLSDLINKKVIVKDIFGLIEFLSSEKALAYLAKNASSKILKSTVDLDTILYTKKDIFKGFSYEVFNEKKIWIAICNELPWDAGWDGLAVSYNPKRALSKLMKQIKKEVKENLFKNNLSIPAPKLKAEISY